MPDSRTTQVEAKRKRAHLREHLLSTGHLTVKDVANLRGSSEAAATAFVEAEYARGQLFRVDTSTGSVLPAALFTDDGDLSSLTEVVAILREAGLDGWELWSWIATPTSRLSGLVPSDLFDEDPERVLRAVRAYAGQLTAGPDEVRGV